MLKIFGNLDENENLLDIIHSSHRVRIVYIDDYDTENFCKVKEKFLFGEMEWVIDDVDTVVFYSQKKKHTVFNTKEIVEEFKKFEECGYNVVIACRE